MSDTSTIALVVLLGSLLLMWLLARTEVLGSMAMTGFVLGAASAASLFALLTE